MHGKGVITDIEQLTPEWLTNIFKKKGYLSNGKVTKIIKKNSLETVTSNVHFLELNFSNDDLTEAASPEIVVKIPKSGDFAKFVGKHETKFYNIVAETMNNMPIPICYDAAFSEETGGSHIILNNLSKTHKEILNYAPIPPSKRYCDRAIDCLAEIHAFWWDDQKLKDFSKYAYVFYTFKENSFNEKEIFNWFQNQNGNLERFLKLLGDRISDKRKELFKTVFSLYPQLAYERIKKENITVIHADAHFWNFFYPKDIENEKNKALLIDWQSWGIGVGCQDLAYMIGLFMYPEGRRLIEKVLIKRYHNDLLKFGVKNYSWDECWYDYRLGALLNLYRIVWWWSVNAPPIVWWDRLEKSFLTLEDLNCLELLESSNDRSL